MLSPEQAVRRLLHSLARPARLLVAVSGGSDSLGLLTLLNDILGEPSADDVRLFAATVDHGLRPESAAEALDVASFCKARGIPHEIRRWQGSKPKTGISAAAREARYALLIEVADELDATAILTGHTFDDQRETVAMRSVRSEDPDNLGLAGMAERVLLQRRRWLARPMLSTRRAEIRDALVARGISWIDDPSNTDSHYERVRMRQALAAEAVSVSREIEAAGLRRTRLSEAAAQILRDHVNLRQGALALIDRAGLAMQPDVLRHLLSTLAAVLGGREYGLRRETGDRVMEFIASGAPGRITAGRVIFDRRREGLFLQRENRGLPQIDLLPGQEVIWDGRFRVRNSTPEVLHIAPLPVDRERAAMLFHETPPSIAMRAMSVLPHIAGDKIDLSDRFAVEPVLAPFDRFLPQFDVTLAREIGILLGCDELPPAPIHDSDRKS
jgi:tRNA(Ile)-lysidine synthase